VYYFYPHITNEKTNIKKLGTFAFLLDWKLKCHSRPYTFNYDISLGPL
jgi:hypothetical protein